MSRRRTSLLLTEKVPYLFTFLMGALGWSFMHMVSQVEQLPVLKVRMTGSSQGDDKRVSAEVKNISAATIFRQLDLYLRPSDETASSLRDADMEYVRPVVADPATKEKPKVSDGIACYHVEELQPFCAVRLLVSAGSRQPVTLWYKSDTAIRLMDSGLETRLIEHEFGVMLGLIGIWLCLLAGYFIFLYRNAL